MATTLRLLRADSTAGPDVDGVLTAGGVTYAGEGDEEKMFHVRDAPPSAWQRLAARRA